MWEDLLATFEEILPTQESKHSWNNPLKFASQETSYTCEVG
jgi:hypothetical protein